MQKKSRKHDSLDALYLKRDRALKHVVAVWANGEGEDTEELNTALDVLTLAHTAATFEWANGS
jgi:hypothetical protein